VWQIDWAHPKFGIILASCSYDGKVFIWKDQGSGSWKKIKEHTMHTASGMKIRNKFTFILNFAHYINSIFFICL